MATRIGDFIAKNPEEVDGEYELRGMMIALLAQSPRVRLYVGFDDAEEIGAWGWASYEQSGRKSWIWSHYAESAIPDYAALYFSLLEQWGREIGATHLLHGTYRDPKGSHLKGEMRVVGEMPVKGDDLRKTPPQRHFHVP